MDDDVRNTYSKIAKDIYDFSVHRTNRLELFDKFCDIMMSVSDADKIVLNERPEVGLDPYKFSRSWLSKK